MKIFQQKLAILAVVSLLTACVSNPVSLGSRVSGSVPTGEARTISAKSCGFQLLLFVPIGINGRMYRAYRALEKQAHGDFITDVHVTDSWGWRFVGTSYCTALEAKAISVKRDAVNTSNKPATDIYAELLRLGDLHKQGILTDAEFEAQKRKILSQ